jgi:hypothetical protein
MSKTIDRLEHPYAITIQAGKQSFNPEAKESAVQDLAGDGGGNQEEKWRNVQTQQRLMCAQRM